jgi:hypothetical protein
MRKPPPPWLYELACRVIWLAAICVTLGWLLIIGGLFLRAAG